MPPLKYALYRHGEVMGRAIKINDSLVYYVLFSSLQTTRECTFKELKSKWKLQLL